MPRPLLLLTLSAGCALSRHPTVPAEVPSSASSPSIEVLVEPGPIALESVVSARFEVPLKGLVNLDHPTARAAGLKDGPVPIVLPVHVLTHPEHGVFVVDTGVPASLDMLGPLASSFLSKMVPVETIEQIAERHGGIDGVFITHAHADHILGIFALEADTPITMGPGELRDRSAMNLVLRRSYRKLLRDRAPVREWDFSGATALAGLPAVDVFGDGSLFALHVPGHTPGSTAYLARTTEGPVLFAGDCAHLEWGWDHSVESGTYTADHAAHARSLAALHVLVARIGEDRVQVFVGHELGGGTGVPAM